jgi:hypothetical protein
MFHTAPPARFTTLDANSATCAACACFTAALFELKLPVKAYPPGFGHASLAAAAYASVCGRFVLLMCDVRRAFVAFAYRRSAV